MPVSVACTCLASATSRSGGIGKAAPAGGDPATSAGATGGGTAAARVVVAACVR